METFPSVSVSSFIAESASTTQSPVVGLQFCSSSSTLVEPVEHETNFSIDGHNLDCELQHLTFGDCELDGTEEGTDCSGRNDSRDGNNFSDRDSNDGSDDDISDYDDPEIALPTRTQRVLRHSSVRKVRPLKRPRNLADRMKLLMDDQSTGNSTFLHTDVQGGLTHPMSSLNYITRTLRRVSVDITPPRLANYSAMDDQEQSMTDCSTEPPSPAHSLLATVSGRGYELNSCISSGVGKNAKSFWSKLWAE